MKFFKFLLSISITLSLIIALDTKISMVPPMGKLLDPFGGFWQNAESKPISLPQEIALTQLKSGVEIYFDSASIPHIVAKNDTDLYFAQGYITASQRLWQMEFQTMAAAGRLSEIIGKDALAYDRAQRRKGLSFGAQNSLKEMEKSPEIYALMQAYSDGVNAYVASLSYKEYPLEYKLLDYQPEGWSPYKSALLLKYMADMLSGGDMDLENTNTLQYLGPELFNLLFPDYHAGVDPVVPKGTPWDFKATANPRPADIQFPLQWSDSSTEKPEPNLGSNNWAIAGSKTASGKPILANDPHLGLNLPSIWYVMQLQSPTVNVMGATLTGALGVVIGFNDSIAWGVTNATRDVRDWYKIKFRDERRAEYLLDGKWLKTQRSFEEIKIRGSESYFDTVTYTHHGPVVYDESHLPENSLNGFALRWTAHDAANEQLSLHKLNRSQNYQDYVSALKTFDCPAQNFAFASASGDIALWVQGKFAHKWPEQGKFLMDGSDSRFEWTGYIPQEQNIHVLNPPRGFVSSANQHPVDETYPYYVYDYSYELYRNRRINQILDSLQQITPEDMMKLQNDNFNLKASEILPLLCAQINVPLLNSEQKELYQKLKNWDYLNTTESREATAFEIWWGLFYKKLWADIGKSQMPMRWPDAYMTTQILKDFDKSIFRDTDTSRFHQHLSILSDKTFRQMSDSLMAWSNKKGREATWGSYKESSILHLARLAPLSATQLMVDGNRGIVNANSGRHGASWRMVVQLGDTVKAWGIYPGGQSGNPGNPHYSNMIESWRTARYLPLLFLKKGQKVDNGTLITLTLNPTQP